MSFEPAMIVSRQDGMISILVATGGDDDGSGITLYLTPDQARDLAKMILMHLDVSEEPR